MSVEEKREFAMKSMNQFDNFCKNAIDCYSIIIDVIEMVLLSQEIIIDVEDEVEIKE